VCWKRENILARVFGFHDRRCECKSTVFLIEREFDKPRRESLSSELSAKIPGNLYAKINAIVKIFLESMADNGYRINFKIIAPNCKRFTISRAAIGNPAVTLAGFSHFTK